MWNEHEECETITEYAREERGNPIHNACSAAMACPLKVPSQSAVFLTYRAVLCSTNARPLVARRFY